jgi:hypothetical protein
MTGVLLHALGDFPLQIASIEVYVSVMAGMLWSCRSWLNVERDASNRAESNSVRKRLRSKASQRFPWQKQLV